MIEDSSAEEMNARFGPFRFRALILLPEFDGKCVLVDFLSPPVGHFNCIHQIVPVLDCFSGPFNRLLCLNLHHFVLGEGIDLVRVCQIYFLILLLSFFQHLLLLPMLLFITYESLFACLSPYADASICTYRNKVIPNRRNRN